MTKNLEASLIQQSRQVLAWGRENQEKIFNTKALIIGAGLLGQMVLGCLSGLGIGEIYIIDDKRSSPENKDFLFPSLPFEGIRKIDRIVSLAREINPSLNINGYHSKLSASLLDYIGFEPDIIIDAQNSPIDREISLDYAISRRKRFISAFYNCFKSVTSVLNQDCSNIEELLDDGEITREASGIGSIPAGVSAGIIVDEVRKSIFSMNGLDSPLVSRVVYNMGSSSRDKLPSDISISADLEKRVLIGGAGALGNYVAMNLALSGFDHIDIIDNDNIEDHNLARQILLYGKAGQPKSSVLLQRIKEFSNVKGSAFIRMIDESSKDLFENNKYDLVMGCFDNQEARYVLSELALKFRIPYIDAGTSPTMGTVSIFVPGQTSCIACKKGLKRIKKRNSCAEALPSVVTPNIIAGSLASAEAIHLFNNTPLKERIVFDSTSERRIYSTPENPSRNGCPCYYDASTRD